MVLVPNHVVDLISPFDCCRNIESKLSRAFLFFAPIGHEFLILVDNQSWRMNKHSRSAQIIQDQPKLRNQ
ncbi:hypothetical protein QQP08_000245 [Theobroma cacao]|nr:hypothetical protein QQP08_000245 [Theobroma cacao]